MKAWTISCNGKTCQPLLISAEEQHDAPKLKLTLNDTHFSVEFANRPDYFASRHGTIAEVTVISANRSKRYKGTAVNRATSNKLNNQTANGNTSNQ